MKLCKVCNKEISNPKRWAYCSQECVTESRKLYKVNQRENYIKGKASWKNEVLEIGKVKHNKKIPINNLRVTNSIATHLKLLLREYNLTTKKYIKITRVDNMDRKMLVVVVTPKMIETLFYKRYEIYKNNFRLDCLRSAKTLAKIFNIVNEYHKKDKNAS